MTRNLIATLISTALIIAPLPAFTADSSVTTPKPAQASGPLAAGKPAGVQQAQGTTEDEDLLYGAGFVTALGLGAWALTSNNNNNNGGGSTPSPTPSPTTTTTTP